MGDSFPEHLLTEGFYRWSVVERPFTLNLDIGDVVFLRYADCRYFHLEL
jgi:hypothetical protein